MFGHKASSGPGGLSINTNSANSIFGSGNNNNNASMPAASIFGSSVSASPSAGTLFGTTATSQGSSLFSNTATAPSKAGTLFGGTAGAQNSAPQPQQQGGLFGGSIVSQPQQQASSSIFGGQQGSNLFGSTSTQQPTQPTSNIFGGLNQGQTQPQQQQQVSNMFGVPASTNGNANPSSLFGNQPQNQPQQRPGVAGPSNSFRPQQTQRSIFSTSIGQYAAQQQTIPGVRINISELRPTTRFNDLYEGLQAEIEKHDNFILQQMHFQDECEQAMPRVASALSYTPSDVSFCAQKLDAVQRALETDAGAIDDVRKLVKADAADARLCFKAIHGLRMPQQFLQTSLWNTPPPPGLSEGGEGGSVDLVSYFSRQADDMSRKLDVFKRSLNEVESYLKGVEASTVAQAQRIQFTRGRDGRERSADDQVRELAAVLREFENGILAVAGKVGGLREQTLEATLGEGIGRRRL